LEATLKADTLSPNVARSPDGDRKKPTMSHTRTITLTSLAMLAFAGNSLFCRIALKHTSIDPASFTTLRLASGALTLWLLVKARQGTTAGRGN